jgi:hypothetical protein
VLVKIQYLIQLTQLVPQERILLCELLLLRSHREQREDLHPRFSAQRLPRLWSLREVIPELLLEHREHVLLIHRLFTLAHLLTSMKPRLILCRVQDVCREIVEEAQQILKGNK